MTLEFVQILINSILLINMGSLASDTSANLIFFAITVCSSTYYMLRGLTAIPIVIAYNKGLTAKLTTLEASFLESAIKVMQDDFTITKSTFSAVSVTSTVMVLTSMNSPYMLAVYLFGAICKFSTIYTNKFIIKFLQE